MTEKKPRRGRPPKKEGEMIQVNTSMPRPLVEEIDEYAAFASQYLYKEVNRTEAIRKLLIYALREWRTKYDNNPNAEPSLL